MPLVCRLTANIVATANEEGAVYITSQEVNEITTAYRNVTTWYDTQIKEASSKQKRGPRILRELKLLMTCASVLKVHFKSSTSPLDLDRLLIFPGTRWCGRGNISGHKEDLGRFRGTDMCCREHDLVVDFIEPLSKKHGIKNMRLWPMTNCEDDQRFYNCLLGDGSDSSLMSACVGTIYFDVLSAQCFKKTYPTTCVDFKTTVLRTTCRKFKIDTSRPTWQTFNQNNFLNAYLRRS
ncbi:phospholipase A2-like [Amblyomma americanum]